jgi:DNA adenine methylase
MNPKNSLRSPDEVAVAKPFLRWAGGKTWLIKHLETLIPKKGFNNYHEPFLGGGSIFLALNPRKNIFLSDLNSNLIETYQAVKLYPNQIIDVMRTFENNADYYYQLRDKCSEDPIFNASKFIYLNQTSFNGIYRVNLEGKYNVPYGYRNKDFLEPNKISMVSTRLKNAVLTCNDFMAVIENLNKSDLVFLDPPYTVSHNDNGFIKYNQKLFSLDDQERLSILIDKIKTRDAYYVLTNAAHSKIDEIFEKGDRKLIKNRANLIGGKKAGRGHILEYIFTNTY